ncbi:hypothetical protein ABTF62_20185, partial [Acinetobacter baumannii]
PHLPLPGDAVGIGGDFLKAHGALHVLALRAKQPKAKGRALGPGLIFKLPQYAVCVKAMR